MVCLSVSLLSHGSLPGTSRFWRPVVWSHGIPICLSLVGLAAPSRFLTHLAAPCLGLMARCSHSGNCAVPAWDWMLLGPTVHCCCSGTCSVSAAAATWGSAAFLFFHYTPSQYYSVFCFIIFMSSYSLLLFLIPMSLPWQEVFLSRLIPNKNLLDFSVAEFYN